MGRDPKLQMFWLLWEEREDAAIKTTIITLKRLNFPDNVIIDNIIKNCSLTEEEAKEALLNYEKE